MLMGDFNINLLNHNIDKSTSNFIDTVYSASFFPTINSPTRITTTSKTMINNIFYNNITEEITPGKITTSISDHLTQFIFTKNQNYSENEKQEIEINSFRNYDKDLFTSELARINWKEYLKLEENDVNKSFELFLNKINYLFNKHCPETKITVKEKCYNRPWLTPGILKSIKVRDKLNKQSYRCKKEPRKTELFNKFKHYRNQIINLTRICKEQYFKEFFANNKKNSKKIWDGIRTILNTKKQKSFKQITLSINKIKVTNELEITDYFNSFFTSIDNNLVDKIPPTQKSFSSYLFNKNENSFFLAPTTKEEIEDIIKNFKLNKALGPNSIPIRILKDQEEEIAKPLHDLISTCFNLGLFRDLLKIAKVIPIFKNKGSSQDCSNYRPISLLSNLSKIIEKLLYQRLYAFLSEHNCLYKHQFGLGKPSLYKPCLNKYYRIYS